MNQALAEIWCAVLGVDRVSESDDFFESGGYSLLAVQLMSRVHEETGVEVAIVSLYLDPTFGGLSAMVGAASGTVPSDGERLDLTTVLAEIDRTR